MAKTAKKAAEAKDWLEEAQATCEREQRPLVEADVPEAHRGTWFLMVVPHYWGRGRTLVEAANEARRAEGKRAAKTLPRDFLGFRYETKATPHACVSEMGGLSWWGEEPTEVARAGRYVRS